MEEKLRHSIHKIEIHWIKVIPIILCMLSFTDTILSYIEIDVPIISYVSALLVWIFLYLSSFAFGFCRLHRMFLYYLLFEGIVNCYDYIYIIPLDLKQIIVTQVFILMCFVVVGLYFHQHDRKDIETNSSKHTT